MSKRAETPRLLPALWSVIGILCLVNTSAFQTPPAAVLTSLATEQLEGSVRIELFTSREVRFATATLTKPDRVYIDLMDTAADQQLISRKIAANLPPLTGIRVGQNRVGVARVVFDLSMAADHQTYLLTDPFRIVVELRPRTGVAVPEPKARRPSNLAEKGLLRELMSVSAETRGGETVVEISFTAPGVYDLGRLSSPERIFLDFSSTTLSELLKWRTLPVNEELLKRVRVGQNERSNVRVVLDLNHRSPVEVKSSDGGSRLQLVLKGPGAESRPEASPDQKSGQLQMKAVAKTEPFNLSGGTSILPLSGYFPRSSLPFLPPAGAPVADHFSSDLDEGSQLKSIILDELVARVNDEYITLSEVHTELALLRAELTEQGLERIQLEATLAQRRRGLLGEMIERRLLSQRAVVEGLSTEINSKVDTFISRILEQAGLASESDLAKLLAERGASLTGYRKLIRERLNGETLLQHVIETKAFVLDSEVLRYYQQHPGEFSEKERIRLAEIFLENETHSELEIDKLTEEIQALLATGESFASLAESFSDGTISTEGGEIGVFEVDSLEPRLQAIVEQLQPGQTSEPIQTQTGVQFLHLMERLPLEPKAYPEVSSQIRRKLMSQKVDAVLSQYVKDLWANSYVEILPKYIGVYDLPSHRN